MWRDANISRRTLVVAAIGTALYFCGVAGGCFARETSAPSIKVSKVPFSRDFTLKPGDAYSFELPDGKVFAVWCGKGKTCWLQFRTGTWLGLWRKTVPKTGVQDDSAA